MIEVKNIIVNVLTSMATIVMTIAFVVQAVLVIAGTGRTIWISSTMVLILANWQSQYWHWKYKIKYLLGQT